MSRKICRWCKVGVRSVDVVVGPSPGTHDVPMLIDREPHEDGTVILRSDGRFRLLMPEDHRDPNKDRFRIHGSKRCEPLGPYGRKMRR